MKLLDLKTMQHIKEEKVNRVTKIMGQKLFLATRRGIDLLRNRLLKGPQDYFDMSMCELIRANVAMRDILPLAGSRAHYSLVDGGVPLTPRGNAHSGKTDQPMKAVYRAALRASSLSAVITAMTRGFFYSRKLPMTAQTGCSENLKTNAIGRMGKTSSDCTQKGCSENLKTMMTAGPENFL